MGQHSALRDKLLLPLWGEIWSRLAWNKLLRCRVRTAHDNPRHGLQQPIWCIYVQSRVTKDYDRGGCVSWDPINGIRRGNGDVHLVRNRILAALRSRQGTMLLRASSLWLGVDPRKEGLRDWHYLRCLRFGSVYFLLHCSSRREP